MINYTNKTQFLFRIEKGILDINDNAVNDHFAEGELASRSEISYTSATVPQISPVCALSIHWAAIPSVFTIWKNTASKDTVRRMIRDERIRYYVPADYTKGSEMDILIHRIIDKTAAYEVLEEKHLRDRKEAVGCNDRCHSS